ncbi:flagellin lysine-N-methylase [Brevibacillus panacihumi]|uniref:flagellin lysine-N-methylase n=1 Tax=Brevibacillus panacihumi TaxID=497735 RepID=UPI003D1E9B57
MNTSGQFILIPQYMDLFQCVGSSCEDTCCAGWIVPIDKATYKKYKSVKEPHLSSKFKTAIKRNRSNPTDHHYASITLSGCKSCEILTEEGLCNIQLQLGEDYLSTTCATYPRVTNIINGSYEISASMSCPEAARLALLNPEPMTFYEIAPKTRQKHSFQVQMNPSSFSCNQIQHHFWGLRIFSIETIQNRNYSITDRVLLLGLFYQNVQEFITNGTVSEIPNLIENYRQLIQNDSLREALTQIPVEATAQIQLLKELVDLRIHIGTENKRYLAFFQSFLDGLSYNDEDDIESISRRYQSAYASYYQPFMDDHSYILENYLVNHIYKNTFPFGNGNPLEN